MLAPFMLDILLETLQLRLNYLYSILNLQYTINNQANVKYGKNLSAIVLNGKLISLIRVFVMK